MENTTEKKVKGNWRGDSGSGLYVVGFSGAAVYYLQASSSFGEGVVGFPKACVWPAFLVYRLLGQ